MKQRTCVSDIGVRLQTRPAIKGVALLILHSVFAHDTIKRSITQLLNKGLVYEAWRTKCYWVIQEYIYANLVNRYGLKQEGYVVEHASRFALYNLVQEDDKLTLTPSRFVSTTVDEVYQAMRNNSNLPNKDKFVNVLNKKLRAKLSVKFS
jgi:hypothetical protein